MGIGKLIEVINLGFGKMLLEKMEEKGIKQSDLARAANIPKSTLSSIINRDNTRVEIDAFLRICKILECVPEDFSEEIVKTKNDVHIDFIKKYNSLDSFGKEVVDAVLNIEYTRCCGSTVKVFKAAHSTNDEPPAIIEVPKSLIDKLENAPDSDDEL